MSNVSGKRRPSRRTRRASPAVPDTAIEALLGRGLYYSQWRGELERAGHVWTPVLKRLQGEVWVEGVPDEREQRLRERRLLSKDAK